MNDKITKKFLEENLFEHPKVQAGFESWYYRDSKKKYEVLIYPLRGKIYCTNNETGEEIEFSNRKYFFCTKEHLKKCLQLININDEFNYNF